MIEEYEFDERQCTEINLYMSELNSSIAELVGTEVKVNLVEDSKRASCTFGYKNPSEDMHIDL